MRSTRKTHRLNPMPEFGRFLGVGLLATLMHVTVAFTVHAHLGTTPQIANFVGFLSSVLLSYFGHANFTFGVTINHKIHLPRFVLLALIGLSVSSLITQVVVAQLGLPFAYAMGMVALIVPMATFVGAKFWAFAESSRARPEMLTGLVLSVALAGVFVALVWGRTINHDTAWYLYATRDWLNGAQLYVDIIEVNPPLNFYLTAPVIWLADYFDISVINAQFAFIGVLLAASLSWVWALLQANGRLSTSQQMWVLVGTAFALTVPAAFGVAQREHIMMLLVTPYVFGYVLSDHPDSGAASILRALVAAIGLCIKPYFMLYPVALTIVRMVQTRKLAPLWSAPNIVILAAGITYLAFVWIIHPEYLNRIVPMALLVYRDYGFGAETILQKASPLIILFFVCVVTLLLRYKTFPNQSAYFVAGVAASVLIYIVQGTGFQYQALPIKVFVALFGIWAITDQKWRSPSFFALVALMAILGMDAAKVGFYSRITPAAFAEIFRSSGPNPKVMVFSTSVSLAFPLVVEENAISTSRYPALWLVPGVVNGLQNTDCKLQKTLCENYAAIQSQTRSDIVEDFVRGSPDIIVFDKRHAYIDQEDFDYRVFLTAEPGFSQQLNQYEQRRVFGPIEVWGKVD